MIVRWTLIAHRYVGIAIGVLMVVWCLSGAVMLYVPYPQLTEAARASHLAPIQWQGCCTVSSELLANSLRIERFQVEQIGSDPVLRARYADGTTAVINLSTGLTVAQFTADQAAEVAIRYAESPAKPLPRIIDYDVWTVHGQYRLHRPLYLFELQGARGTNVYVSSRDGRAVQVTTATERFWNWLGSVPHWLYVPALRAHPVAWTQTVVWTSTLGCFLAITGIVVGIIQIRRSGNGRWIPYRGYQYWHHLLGLVFGLFVLTWIASGLLSMNPWGLFESSEFDEPRRIAGNPVSADDALAAVKSVAAHGGEDIVSLETASLGGVLYLVATKANGARVRLNSKGEEQPLSGADAGTIARAIFSGESAYKVERIDREDSYYFSHHREQALLPALRVTSMAGAGPRYYLDPISGEIRAKFDWDARQYRWWHQGLHRWDFAPALRARPLWDVVTLTLLLGVTSVCAIGTYLGIRSLRR